LEDKWVLIPSEQLAIKTATTAYNAIIKTLAQENGLAFADVNALLKQASNGGVPFDGGVLTSQFVTGGTFSLDGVHPTPRGNAAIANLVIDAINQTYNSTVPKVNIGAYGTITLSNEVQ
ncbi:MAG TPA: hypothetical protein VK833_07005, partial [Gillisia sp.]|nr:hypothetical protein [Gillisia sp.]